MNKVIAIYPGTFDPITFGHIDIIRRATKIFNNLVIAVAEDTTKSPLFTLNERVEMVNKEIVKIRAGAGTITATSFKGLLIEFAQKKKATVILRGLRAASDFEYEFQMSYMNHKLSSKIETLFLPANENGHFISSRFVKELARLGGNTKNFVPEGVEKKLKEKFGNV